MPDGKILIYKKFGFSHEVALVDDDNFIRVGPFFLLQWFTIERDPSPYLRAIKHSKTNFICTDLVIG